MATIAEIPSRHPAPPRVEDEPVLQPGDSLTREEFERRYHRMPGLKKAELIEGIVYMPSPVRIRKHGRPHFVLSNWLGAYEEATPGVIGADNSTVRLDLENEPQPDLILIIEPERGGQCRYSTDDYLEGPPELCVEIAAGSAAYDMHQKKRAYRRNGVREYLLWLTEEKRVIWWELRAGEYKDLQPDAAGILKSTVFPGLWLDPAALLSGDRNKVRAVLQQGLATSEHAVFAASLAKA